MSKNLLKFYIFFIITFLIFINIFPSIFINIKNTMSYIVDKTITDLEGSKDNEINIYSNKGNVIIMLDDGWKTQYTVGYNYMHKKNMRGSIAVIPSLVGHLEYMNKGNLYRLYKDNWDLLNHTYSHAILSDSNINKQIEEISKADEWLYKNGFIDSNNILIYPEGKYNSDTITVMSILKYISGRSIEEGYNPKIPINLYDIKVKNILSNTNVEDVKKWIDHTISNNLTLILLFHKLENNIDNTLMKYKEDEFYKIIDYVDKKRVDLNIITYSEWIQTIISA